MVMFIRIKEAQVLTNGSWLLKLGCQWQGTFFSHEGEWSITLATPLTHDDKDALRWYFDEFSWTSPFQLGKAKDAAQRIATFAQRVTQLIRDIPALKSPLHHAHRILIELCFSQRHSSLAELPWEALECDSHWQGALARDVAICVVRSVASRIGEHSSSQTMKSRKAIQNVLLVSARSSTSCDILPDLLTLPIVGLTESLPANQKPVLHFARPATWEQVRELLRKHNPGFFHVVHFDVHGLYVKDDKGKRKMCLQFSPPDLSSKGSLVDCEVIAAELGDAKVKIVVANACQSASLEGGWENNLAAALANAGVLYTAAMSYKISACGAKVFVQGLYDELMKGKEPWQAVRLARTRMQHSSQRHGRFGRAVHMQDWVVPVVYASTKFGLDDVSSARNWSPELSGLALVERGDEYPHGRAFDISSMESAIFSKKLPSNTCRVLILYGTGGIGKSHLLRYLNWWWEVAHAFSQTVYLDFAEGTHVTGDLGLKPNGTSTTAVFLDNLDAIIVPNDGAGRQPWNSRDRREFFDKLQRSLGREDAVILCSRVPIPWPEIQNLGTILEHELGPPADIGTMTRRLDTLGVLEQYQGSDECIAIQNIVEMMSYHPTALQAATELMVEKSFTARQTYRLLHEMVFGLKPQAPPDAPLKDHLRALLPPDIKEFHISPSSRFVQDLENAFNSARNDPMLIAFLAIIGCYRQLLPPDLVEIEDILRELIGVIDWEHEFRQPSLSTFFLWMENWGLINTQRKTDMGYIYLNPLIWFTLQYLFETAFSSATVTMAKIIGYASFVKFTMKRLSIGRLDNFEELPEDSPEKVSEIVSMTVALTFQTPPSTVSGPLIEVLAFENDAVPMIRLIRSFKVMIGPRLNPPHSSYFSALHALECLNSRLAKRNDAAQLEAVEGLCMLFAQNDWASFLKWTSVGLARVKALQPTHYSKPSWLYFDFTFRYISTVVRLMQSAGGFTPNWQPGPLDAELIDLEAESYASIPRDSEYYIPYHTVRLAAHMKVFIGAGISHTPLKIVNTIRAHIITSCDILLDNVTTSGDTRRTAQKIRIFFARDFESMPDMMQVYLLASLLSPLSPSAIGLLRNAGSASLGLEKTYERIVQAINEQDGTEPAHVAKVLHFCGAISAWHRNDTDCALEHLRAAEEAISPAEIQLKMILWYLYAKVYAKIVTALPFGGWEKDEMMKKVYEAFGQIYRMIEMNQTLEEQIRGDEALELIPRLRLIFDDDGVRKEFSILEWWHWREKKREQLNDPSFDGWKGYIGTPRFMTAEEKRKWGITF